MKKEYIAPAVTYMGIETTQMIAGSIDIYGQQGDGTQLSKNTIFAEPEEKGDVADEYFEQATELHVEFRNIWGDE